MNAEVAVTLPGGTWHGERRVREAVIRPLRGRDEAFLAETAAVCLPVEWATALLTRCVERIGPVDEFVPQFVDGLTVGDREALLLHVRRATFGETISCALDCPVPACAERLEWDLHIEDLLQPPYAKAEPFYEEALHGETGEAWTVRFRLPTGADQKATASTAIEDPEVAADKILLRCVESVTTKDGKHVPDAEWLASVRACLPERILDLDPQAELTLTLTCPVCGHIFTALLDAADYFFREVDRRGRSLYEEVHQLAYHYHWSEGEIMSMGPRTRRRYLELLADTLGEQVP